MQIFLHESTFHTVLLLTMEALEMVALDQNYMEWLEESALSLETNEQIKQANRILTEMINSKNRNDYIKIKEENGVHEMQRQVLTANADGTIRTSVVTQQFVEVTTRKRKYTDNVDTEQQTNTIEKREERQCKWVENVIRHVLSEIHKCSNFEFFIESGSPFYLEAPHQQMIPCR